jgi:hypothetical protein
MPCVEPETSAGVGSEGWCTPKLCFDAAAPSEDPAMALAAALLRERDEYTLARAGVDAVVRFCYPVEGQRVASGY